MRVARLYAKIRLGVSREGLTSPSPAGVLLAQQPDLREPAERDHCHLADQGLTETALPTALLGAGFGNPDPAPPIN